MNYGKDFYACVKNAKYNPDTFPAIAFYVLSSKPMQTKSHLCKALQCSRKVLYEWIKKYSDFAEAVETGLIYGEGLFREKLADHAFKPQAQVNNGLIKLLANNVYGIKDESPQVIVHNSNMVNSEQALRERGIPLPEVGLEDIEDI